MGSWAIYMRMEGIGVKTLFRGGFTTEEEAVDVASLYGWEIRDRHGFLWTLWVEKKRR